MTKYNIKLPRKKKKAYIKKHSRHDYWMTQILNEVLHEDGVKRLGWPKTKKTFPNGQQKVISYW